jgi:hypothetical protein
MSGSERHDYSGSTGISSVPDSSTDRNLLFGHAQLRRTKRSGSRQRDASYRRTAPAGLDQLHSFDLGGHEDGYAGLPAPGAGNGPAIGHRTGKRCVQPGGHSTILSQNGPGQTEYRRCVVETFSDLGELNHMRNTRLMPSIIVMRQSAMPTSFGLRRFPQLTAAQWGRP